MRKNDLLKHNGAIIRVLGTEGDRVLIIDCIKRTMPKWVSQVSLNDFDHCEPSELFKDEMVDVEELQADSRKAAYLRYTMISGILPYVADDAMRNHTIEMAAVEFEVDKKTVKKYLCLYLAYQCISVLAPAKKAKDKGLSQDQKNIRWGLNKFFYTKHKNSLRVAYTMMLKSKYCDGEGKLLPSYPSFNQFRYHYRKTKNMQTFYITRDGIKSYQRNNRPCIGDGVRAFAAAPGVGMLDATICDLYLVSEEGSLIGRPILTACIDAYSGLCCGYSLTLEGGSYSIRNLMLNVVADKVEHCERFGIHIDPQDWPSKDMPGKLISDKGMEYTTDNFAQLAELGVMITNLPSYRPELKGPVEKFFDLVQESYKPYLKGKGVIEPDYMERGAYDYRKDACLTLNAFEKIVIHCILFHNSKRVFGEFPFTDEMIEAQVEPHANSLWTWGVQHLGANLIPVTTEELMLTLLPRVSGKFTRFGLIINKMKYHHTDYTESYLQGEEAIAAYNPYDVSNVWLIEAGAYTKFELIESRFKDKTLQAVNELKTKQRQISGKAYANKLQAEVDVAQHIEAVVNATVKMGNTNLKDIRSSRKKEQMKQRVNHIKEAGLND